MAAKVEGDSSSYHARLDRTPEPRAFQHLGDEDKRMIYNLRTVVSGTRDKFSKLKDAVENKEKELEKEAALRKELEDRLQEHLVNMYDDDSVNEELRQRLPRANKDPSITLNGDRVERSALDDIEEEITASRMQQDESGYGHWDDEEVAFTSSGRRGRNSQQTNSKQRGRRRPEYYSDEEYEPQHNRSSRRHRDYPSPGGYPGYYPPQQPYMPMYQYPMTPGMPGSAPQPYMMHPGMVTPQQNSQTQMPMHSTPNGMMNGADNQNISQNQNASVQGQVQGRGQGQTTNKNEPPTKYGLLKLGAAGSTQNLDGTGASEGSVAGADASADASAASTSRSTGLVHITGIDPHRQITLLLAELDRLKDKNKKLNEEIIDLTRQLASLSASAETRDKEVEAQVAAKVADVIEEIYTAQKQRDAAMMQRLRLANEERDEAVMRFKKMQADGELNSSEYDDLITMLDAEAKVDDILKAIKNKHGLQKIPEKLVSEARVPRSYSAPLSPLPEQREWSPYGQTARASPVQRDWSAPVQVTPRLAEDFEDIEDIYDPDEATVETMLEKINGGDSYKDIGKEGDVICSKINDARKRKKRITAEEMKAILEERDAALVKMKRYEQELSRLQRQGYGKQAPDNNEQALRAKLLAISQERDMALAKVQRLEDEMQTLRVYYSLHKSLSQEANLRDQFNNTLENITVQLKERDGNIELAQKENNILLAQLKAITMEKNELAEQLDKMQLNKQEADATIEKLQRLVNVLRRKINGSRAD